MGRKPEFDRDVVLDAAMELFWMKGYEQTSLRDLMDRTGLHKGSLYGAFGSKENLFRLALQRYNECRLEAMKCDGNAAEFLRDFVFIILRSVLDENGGRGCFIFNSGLELAESHSLGLEARNYFDQIEKDIRSLVVAGIEQGSLQNDTDVDVLTYQILGALFSILELARIKKKPEMLEAVAQGALSALDNCRSA